MYPYGEKKEPATATPFRAISSRHEPNHCGTAQKYSNRRSARRKAKFPHRGLHQVQAWKATFRGDPSKTGKQLQKHQVWVPKTAHTHTDSPVVIFHDTFWQLRVKVRWLCYRQPSPRPYLLSGCCLHPSSLFSDLSAT